MTDDERKLATAKQAQEWADELREIRNKVDKFANRFVGHRGLTCSYVDRILATAYYTLGQIEYRDLKQIAEDNQ